MLKYVFSMLSILLIIQFNSQVTVKGVSPQSITSAYTFTWADPAGGWGTPNFNIPATFVQDTLKLANDGTAGLNAQGNPISAFSCNTLPTGSLNGKIAVVFRGDGSTNTNNGACEFSLKALNAQNAGAVGVIIVNRNPNEVISMGSGANGVNITIPVVMIDLIDGQTLVSEMQNGPVVMFIGNKTGIYANDIALSESTSLAPKGGMIHSLLAQNGNEFNFEIGSRVFNPGNIAQTNVSLNAKITNPSGAVVYNNTVSGLSFGAMDTIGINIYPGNSNSFPQFSLSSYPPGTYTLKYTANLVGTDQFPNDNIVEFTFTINDTVFSYSTKDPITNSIKATNFYRPGTNNSTYSICSVIKDPNASRVAATGLYFSATTSVASGVTLEGEELALKLYKWDDSFTDLNDPGFGFNSLIQVASGSYTYPGDLQEEVVYGAFNHPTVLINNQRYLACVQTVNLDLYLGYGNQDYTWNTDVYLQPMFPNESDGTYFGVGFGTDLPTSLGIRLISSNCQTTTNVINADISCGPYTLNGQSYNTPGQYTQTIFNQNGCDSIIILNLLDYSATNVTIQPANCQGTTPNGSILLNFPNFGNGSNTVQGDALFFSEYYSNGLNNHVIEIYNSSTTPFDIGANLAAPTDPYTIYFKMKNSSNQVFSFPQNTIIPPQSTLTISHPNSNYNGNLTSTIVDGSTLTLFYEIIEYNYTENWDLASSFSYSTQIRNQNIVTNNTTFNSNEWLDSPLYNSTLGSHWPSSINPGYTFQWFNGSNNSNLTNLPSGYYSYNVLYNGCVVESNQVFVPWTNTINLSFTSNQQLFTSPPFAVQFTNTSNNSNNVSYTWDFGDGEVLTSNNSNIFHEYLYNGLYSVSLVGYNNLTGCSDTTTFLDYIYCTGGSSCTHTAIINQSGTIQACQGTPIWLTCNSDPSYSYQWRRNGVSISGNNNDSIQVTQSGSYSVIISVNNCPVISNSVVVTISASPSTPLITTSGLIQPCLGGSLTLSTGNYPIYNWSTGATTQSIVVSNSGSYTVTVTNANGCSTSSLPYNVNASTVAEPQVCLVGIDSLTNKNRVVWEKPMTQGIDSFYVYKESNVSNIYTKIGATDYNDLAVFIDINSNPAVQAYRYKISALDTCGTETNLGDFHKTIHLTINQGIGGAWNLIWSHYEGINFGSYNIYRGSDPTNISLLTTIQSNLNSYTDLTPPSGPLFYQIELVNPVNCDPTKILNYDVSRSNIVNNGLSELSKIENIELNIYPNPTSHSIIIKGEKNLYQQFSIFDQMGREVFKGKLNGIITEVNLSMLSKGIYTLRIDGDYRPTQIVKE